MTVTLNLPPNVEQAFLGEAAALGLTPDEFVSEVLLARAASRGGVSTAAELPGAQLQMQEGVPVLWTGQSMALPVINDTLDLVRRERDLSSFGLSNWGVFLTLSFSYRCL